MSYILPVVDDLVDVASAADGAGSLTVSLTSDAGSGSPVILQAGSNSRSLVESHVAPTRATLLAEPTDTSKVIRPAVFGPAISVYLTRKHNNAIMSGRQGKLSLRGALGIEGL